MTVTALCQKTDDRFELELDGAEKLTVPLSLVADFSLYAGRELNETEAERLRGAVSLERAKARALRMLGMRAMSTREIYDRLVEKGEREQDAAACVAWLLELHLLSDEDYAAAVVRRCAAKGYGARRAREELNRHKLPRALWDAALETLPEQDETLDRLLLSRLRGASPDDRAALKKATDALLRRGFGWDEIRAAVERLRLQMETDDTGT